MLSEKEGDTKIRKGERKKERMVEDNLPSTYLLVPNSHAK